MSFSKAKHMILPAGLSADLDWKKQKSLAFQESSILWHLDFSFSTTHFSPQDFLKSQSQLLAIEHFCRVIWNDCKKITAGVILYQGTTDFSRIFPKELWLESFFKWMDPFIKNAAQGHELKEASPIYLEHYYELYAAKLFAEVMQRLFAFLPEECVTLLLIEVKESLSFLAQKFSLEYFEPFVLLDLRKNQLPFLNQKARLGICLPPDSYCDQKILTQIHSVFIRLQQKQIDFRCIPEAKLNHFWNGLDSILVFSRTLSNQGKRQLLGFCATGGRVVIEGDSLCLPQEISLLDFLQIF
ncbi:MAG: hypothetical protein LBC45_03605 [Chlamydiales bacterium]|jgi:hypothetical protein|nr:hypothetical protein [Chlamydiales bacterium]